MFSHKMLYIAFEVGDICKFIRRDLMFQRPLIDFAGNELPITHSQFKEVKGRTMGLSILYGVSCISKRSKQHPLIANQESREYMKCYKLQN